MASLRETILGLDDLERVEVVVPQWGNVKLFATALTAADLHQLQQKAPDEGEDADWTAFWIEAVVLGTVDEKGARIFTDADRAALKKKSAVAINILGKAIGKLNGLTKEATAALEKN